MKPEFQKVYNAFDSYPDRLFASQLHLAVSVDGKTYLCNSGEFLLDRMEVEQTIKYCRQYLEHADDEFAEKYNEDLLEMRDEERRKIEKEYKKKPRRPTYIYLIINHRTGYYKIGKSNKPEYREKTLQDEIPEIEMIHTVVAPSSLESELHQMFALKRLRGEWFKLGESDVEYIKSLK